MPGYFVFAPDKLRAVRKRVGMSREQLAITAGSSYPAISLYENRHRIPNRDTLVRLATALGVDPSELVEDDPSFTKAAS